MRALLLLLLVSTAAAQPIALTLGDVALAGAAVPKVAAPAGPVCNVLKDSASSLGDGAYYESIGGYTGGIFNYCAVKFTASSSYTACSNFFYLIRVGDPSFNLSVNIYSHDGDNDCPGSALGTWTGSVAASSISTESNTLVGFSGPSVSLEADTVYWVVLRASTSGDETNYIKWKGIYSSQYTYVSSNGSSWGFQSGTTCNWFLLASE